MSLFCAGFAQTATPPPAPSAPPLPTTPSLVGTLAGNPSPVSVDAGPLGKVFVTGVVSGIGLWQDKPSPGDHGGVYDISNGQVFVQTTAGKIQFFVQAGTYSLPALGTPYIHSDVATRVFYGALPQAFVKLAPNDAFSIEAGKLPTLLGAESTFSFENMNIERGLLWNQENAVNRGVQANYAKGPWALAAYLNDGMYSNQLSWLTFSVTDTTSSRDSVSLVGGGNTIHTSTSTVATPLFLNNEQIYDLIYTHTQGPWIVQPYLQYSYVPRIPSIGATHSASTSGAALIASYAFGPHSKLAGVTLPFRVEYITSTGSVANGAPNLLYGPGSNAWSATLTPTYQRKSFFARAEISFVGTGNTTAGSVFGSAGNGKNQTRMLFETGVMF